MRDAFKAEIGRGMSLAYARGLRAAVEIFRHADKRGVSTETAAKMILALAEDSEDEGAQTNDHHG